MAQRFVIILKLVFVFITGVGEGNKEVLFKLDLKVLFIIKLSVCIHKSIIEFH